jgi:hypothetical protein
MLLLTKNAPSFLTVWELQFLRPLYLPTSRAARGAGKQTYGNRTTHGTGSGSSHPLILYISSIVGRLNLELSQQDVIFLLQNRKENMETGLTGLTGGVSSESDRE